MPLADDARSRRGVPVEDVGAALRRRLRAVQRTTIRQGLVESAAVIALVGTAMALPGHPPVDGPYLIAVLAGTAVTTGALAAVLSRLADGSLATVGFVAWACIDCAAIASGVAVTGGARSDLYLVYLVLAVFQSGASFPRVARVVSTGLSVASYLVALAVTGWHLGASSLLLRVGMLVLVAWGVDMLSGELVAELRGQVVLLLGSQRRAALWRQVASLGGSLDVLDPGTVWDWVMSATAALGFTSASVAVIDHDRGEYRVERSFGLPAAFTGSVHPWSVGMVGAVLGANGTCVVDYANFPAGHPSVRQCGLRTTVGIPIRADDVVAAVLTVGVQQVTVPSEEELAALELLAAYASHGLSNVGHLDRQRRQTERIQRILDGAPDAMVVCDATKRVLQVNFQAARLFGWESVTEAVGTVLDDLFDEASAGRLAEAATRLATMPGAGSLSLPASSDEPPLRVRTRTGTTIPVEVTVARVDVPDGPVCTAAIRDISERLTFEARLAHQATHDELTGLPNRRAVLDHLATALTGRDGTSGPVAVCTLDIDHFKDLNDSRGHDVGDQLVVQVAARLRRRVEPGDLVARLGGDELAVVTTTVPTIRRAAQTAGQWLDVFDEPFELDGGACHVTASAGVALATRGDRPADVLRRADAAMYLAKRRGRARVEVYDDALTASAAWRLDVASALHGAAERHELFVVYQPIVDLFTEAVVGVEALLRWQRPDGLVAPADFVPVAEDSGLIVPIGRWVLAKACRQVAQWSAILETSALAPNAGHASPSPSDGSTHPASIPTASTHGAPPTPAPTGGSTGPRALGGTPTPATGPSTTETPAPSTPGLQRQPATRPLGDGATSGSRWSANQPNGDRLDLDRRSVDRPSIGGIGGINGTPWLPRVSVNVSSRQLAHDQLVADVADALRDSGLPPACLTLEITESAFIDDLPATIRRIGSLRRLGVRVAIDDFGTGYSSLSALARLPVDAVKIDKSFVDGLGTRYDTVVKAVVDVANGFGLTVVAEGVERRRQVELLRGLGCHLAQGYWFSRPLDATSAGRTVIQRRCPTIH
jgi:diguanylate cyclase (GGDEF)-like protein/PAS domain S-box-containing protein